MNSVAEWTQEPMKGLAHLMTRVLAGEDLTSVGNRLREFAISHPGPLSADALMDLSIILHLKGCPDYAEATQQQALQLKQMYRLPAGKTPAVRLLAINSPGILSANTPLEFLVQDSDVELNILYIAPNIPFPHVVPEHDVMFVGVGESERNLEALKFLEMVVARWPRPVLNRPERIARLSRDSVAVLLQSVQGLTIPITTRIHRNDLQRLAADGGSMDPIIVRPVDSHAGQSLIKADNTDTIRDYLQNTTGDEFFVARFIDYSSADGLFRKYRVVLIEGRPYAGHMAVSTNWMVHYLNGGMDASPMKRNEEARFMSDFDDDFAMKHRAALDGIAQRMGLDYLVVDCAETWDGKLLVFEVDSSAVVHAMDSPELFPYKKPQMQKVFGAFRAMLLKTMTQSPPFSYEL